MFLVFEIKSKIKYQNKNDPSIQLCRRQERTKKGGFFIQCEYENRKKEKKKIRKKGGNQSETSDNNNSDNNNSNNKQL